MRRTFPPLLVAAVLVPVSLPAGSGDEPRTALDTRFALEDAAQLAREARESGDPTRGALVFFRPSLQCARCHAGDDKGKPPSLGPELATIGRPESDRHVVDSILAPSKEIRRGFEPVTVARRDGTTLTGLLAGERPDAILVRDPTRNGMVVAIARGEIEETKAGGTSLMPAGLTDQLTDRREFLDLVRYILEITELGPARALALRPPESAFAVPPLPDYERHVDHAGMIAGLGPENYRRGEAIFDRVCANCHGTRDRPGSLPTSPRFASGVLKNGADPFRMYQTLTHGFGQMAPQSWMVPEQKYDVIHYIREAYLKPLNPSQYVPADRAYVASLPNGDTRGPRPTAVEPWLTMDYGPTLVLTCEVGDDGSNFAYKGIAVRLDPGPGGISRGRAWALFEHDTLRLAAGWTGAGFIDWNGINFNGRHEIHPRVAGLVEFANPAGPGWADPATGTFADPRPRGRDGRAYGPLPRSWAHYRGQYRHGDKVILSYTVGQTDVLEMPGVEKGGPTPAFSRTFNLGPRETPMVLQVARGPVARLRTFGSGEGAKGVFAFLGPEPGPTSISPREATSVRFDGSTHVEIAKPGALDLSRSDFSIAARFRTRRGGSLFAETAPGESWVPDGRTLFVRNGRLVFDIGWVGALESSRRVDDGELHEAVLTYEHPAGKACLFIDGRRDQEKKLPPRGFLDNRVVRIGFTAPDFPEPASHFDGRIEEIRLYKRALGAGEAASIMTTGEDDARLVSRWKPDEARGGVVRDETGHGLDGRVVRPSSPPAPDAGLLAGVSPPVRGIAWSSTGEGDLRLAIPAGKEALRFTVGIVRVPSKEDPEALASSIKDGPATDLAALARGGPSRWPDVLKTTIKSGTDDGPFAIDVLTPPDANPWNCRMRLSGLDFLPGGGALAVCTWDGDVWRVDGLDDPAGRLTWRRFACGLFQPLGLKIVNGVVHVSCRDQIVALRDLDHDGEADFYENINSDHQVTEHFHEFAMDLQTDAGGNFYYAKAARHGKTAVVPQHGTLLKVAPDGSRTEILATGFRAPNGICLNPDGSFFSTDQEGFWLPKNRINHVVRGGFYGNMWGYHDVTDASDAAMAPPVCWITNTMDRSPAEPVWVSSDRWGPLKGSLLNLSYGMGKVFAVPHEVVAGTMQGGVCELPGASFPTGVMRGRFHPADGQLYLCGLFAWAGNREQPGGLYRLRHTGKAVHVPIGLHARKDRLELTFSGPLDRATAADRSRFSVSTWTLRRSANYGSKHHDERTLKVDVASLSADARTISLGIHGLGPTQCMEIVYDLKGSAGEPVGGRLHNTIHHLGD